MRKTWRSWNTEPTWSLIARADARSWPIGFSSTTRVFGRHQAGRAEAHAGLAEQLRRGREVEHPDAIAVVELGDQLAPALGLRGIGGDIVETVEKARQAAFVDILGRNIAAQVLLDLRDVALAPQVAARDADDPALGRQLPVAIAVVEAGQQLAPGEVAGGPEHREVERVDRYDLCRQDAIPSRP